MEEDQIRQPYEIQQSQIIKEIEEINWADLQSQFIHPNNQFYKVQYPQKYEKYYRIFRILLQKQQISERSYKISNLILQIRSSNYYAMMLRKKYFFSQPYESTSLHKQFHFINCLLNNNQKQYQLWTYKKQMFRIYKQEVYQEPSFYQQQIQFIQYCLEIDSKNYHAWDYLFWITSYFHKEKEQIMRTELLLFSDNQIVKELNQQLQQSSLQVIERQWKKCYPLWSYRYNLLKNVLNNLNKDQRQQRQRQELQRIDRWIRIQRNESSEEGWNYLVGMLLSYSIINQHTIEKYLQYSLSCYRKNNTNRFSANSYLQLSDFMLQKYQIQSQNRQQILKSLLQSDKVRRLYYNYLLSI